jgi:uncharacterized repeat protein (TIGR03943 family)
VTVISTRPVAGPVPPTDTGPTTVPAADPRTAGVQPPDHGTTAVRTADEPGPTAITRPVQAVVMLLLGGAVVRAGVTGMSLRYVKEGLRPFLIIAGLLLIAAAAMTLWYEFHPASHDTGHDEEDDGHGHAHHEPRVGWLLILPVLALLLVAPPALGSYAAGQSGSVLTAQNSQSDYPPLPAGDPAELDLLDYASRAVFDQGKTLTGRTIRLTGFITPGADGQPMLARIVLACCAADGRPIKVALTGNAPTSVQADTWVTLVGTYSPQTTKDPVNNAVVPYLEVTTWEQISTPDQPYE